MNTRTTGVLDDVISYLLSVDPYRIVLFGSAAVGERGAESDIDLLVILDSQAVRRTYGQRMAARITVRDSIREINGRLPIDLVVYTRAEYDLLRKQGASFLSGIESSGKTLYEKPSESVA